MSIFSALKSALRRKRLARRDPAEIFTSYARRNKWGDKMLGLWRVDGWIRNLDKKVA